MPEDDKDLLSIFSSLPDATPAAPSRLAPASGPRPARWAPPPEDDKILMSEISDLFGGSISAAALDSFHGPSEEQLRKAKEDRERLQAQAAAVAQAPAPPPVAPETDVQRLEAKLRQEMEQEIRDRVQQEMVSREGSKPAPPSREQILAQVRSQMAEWDELRKQQEDTESRTPTPMPEMPPPISMAPAPPPVDPTPILAAGGTPERTDAAPLAPPSLPPPSMPMPPPVPLNLPMPPVPLAGPPPLPVPPPSLPQTPSQVGGLKISHEPAQEVAPPPKKTHQLTDMARLDLLIMFEESRKVISQVVSQLIGSKATLTMLTRTFDKSRAKHQKVFRNVNWKADGSLREDGSLEKDRTLKNLAEFPVTQRSEELIQALADLLSLRLQAIEQGLARKVKAAVICDITEQLEKMAQMGRCEHDNVALFVEEILPPVTLD